MFDLARKYAVRGLMLATIVGPVMISSPADAHGYRGGGHGGGGWDWGWGVAAGVALGAAAYGWPGYYYGPYGYYPYYADPPVTVVQQPVVVAPQQAPVAATYYYCDDPAGYYPYVQSCNRQWRPVPATPPSVAAPPQ